VFSGAYLLPFILHRYIRPAPVMGRAALAGCGLLFAVAVHSKATQASYFVPYYDKAAVLATYPEESLTLAATDCGILGYFSRQHVINLDGLTSSWDLQRVLADGTLAGWLAGHGLNAYVGPPAPVDGLAVLHARAGLASPPRALPVRVEPMSRKQPSADGVEVYRVTAAHHGFPQ
jgi:hypothetical protein